MPVFALALLLAAPLQVASATDPVCTARWRAIAAAGNPKHLKANAFGQACLLEGRPVPAAITVPAAHALLGAVIRPASPLATVEPADVAAFCPHYKTASPAQRLAFWRELMVATMAPESRYKPATAYWEGTEYSVGLLQMSFDNGCSLRREPELIEPATNVACAVHVMGRLLSPKPGRPVLIGGGDHATGKLGLAHYWSTLRIVAEKPRGEGEETRGPIAAATRKLPGCS